MTDNIGEQMTEEEIRAARPAGDYSMQVEDVVTSRESRTVVMPAWLVGDGRYAQMWQALNAAQEGKMATAHERMIEAAETLLEYGKQLGGKEQREECDKARQHGFH